MEELDSLRAKIQQMAPRGYKADGTGTVTQYSVDQIHLDANDNPISMEGTATIRKGETTEQIPVLWNVVGGAFQTDSRAKVLLDLVKKVNATE